MKNTTIQEENIIEMLKEKNFRPATIYPLNEEIHHTILGIPRIYNAFSFCETALYFLSVKYQKNVVSQNLGTIQYKHLADTEKKMFYNSLKRNDKKYETKCNNL